MLEARSHLGCDLCLKRQIHLGYPEHLQLHGLLRKVPRITIFGEMKEAGLSCKLSMVKVLDGQTVGEEGDLLTASWTSRCCNWCYGDDLLAHYHSSASH